MSACKTCIYWEQVSDKHGKCRVNPPRAELIPMQGIGGQGLSVVTFYPETKPEDWCSVGSPDPEKAQNLVEPSTILQPN